MTLPRVVVLAQALAMIMTLAPGTGPDDRGSALGAAVPIRTAARLEPVLQAEGSGVGCEAGTQRFKGPRPPGAPPWPPGAEPTPTPSPTPAPSLEALPIATPAAEADLEPASGSATASGSSEAGMLLLAATGVRVAQAEASPPAGSTPSPAPLPSVPPSDPGASGSTASPAPLGQLPVVSGIDLSHHNGDVDFDRIREAGYRFAYLKATQDNDFIDPMFATNLARARQAGLLVGGYHFFDYTLDGREQADHFLDRLEAVGGLDDVLPPVVDVECWSPVGPSIHALSTARLRDFVERVYERIGRTPVIYTSWLMWDEVVGNAEGFDDLTLWAACWECESPPTIASGWDTWTFWQTGIDRIRGVGSLDGNLFSGSPADLATLRLRPLSIEGGALATNRQQVALDLGGRDATYLRTSSDGRTWTRWSPIRGTPRATLASGEEGVEELLVQLRKGSSLKSPVFRDSISVDLTGPSVSHPAVTLGLGPLSAEAVGATAAAEAASSTTDGTADAAPTDGETAIVTAAAELEIPIEVTWEASDEVAGMGDATISVACGEAPSRHFEATATAPPGVVMPVSAVAVLAPDTSCAVTVIGRDGAGNTTRVSGPTVEARLIDTSADEQPAVTVEAAQAGVVARRGPDQGSLTILVDGDPIEIVDLFAREVSDAEVVAVVDLDPGTPRTLTIEPVEMDGPPATGTLGAVDGFVTLTTT